MRCTSIAELTIILLISFSFIGRSLLDCGWFVVGICRGRIQRKGAKTPRIRDRIIERISSLCALAPSRLCVTFFSENYPNHPTNRHREISWWICRERIPRKGAKTPRIRNRTIELISSLCAIVPSRFCVKFFSNPKKITEPIPEMIGDLVRRDAQSPDLVCLAFLRRDQSLTNPLSTPEKLAIACAGIPLTVGTSIYLLWRMTSWTGLELAGVWTIGIGICLFLIGSLLLLSEFVFSKSSRRNWARKLGIGILLLANFPAALFFVDSAVEVSNRTRYVIEVVNNTEHDVTSFRVISDKGKKTLGPIAIGSSAKTEIQVSKNDCLSQLVTSSEAEIKSIQSADSCFNDIGDGISIELLPNGVVNTRHIKK